MRGVSQGRRSGADQQVETGGHGFNIAMGMMASKTVADRISSSEDGAPMKTGNQGTLSLPIKSSL